MSRKSDIPRAIGWRWSYELQRTVPIFSNAERTRLMRRYARRREVLEHRNRKRIPNRVLLDIGGKWRPISVPRRFDNTRRIVPHLVGGPHPNQKRLVWIG